MEKANSSKIQKSTIVFGHSGQSVNTQKDKHKKAK